MKKVGKWLGFKMKHDVWNGHGNGYGLKMYDWSHGLEHELWWKTTKFEVVMAYMELSFEQEHRNWGMKTW